MKRQLIYGDDFRACSFVEQRIRAIISPPYVAIGVTPDGGKTLCGGIVFNHWNGSNIEISIAIDKHCLTRRNIRTVYAYAFEQAGARRITAVTRRSNSRMRELLPRLGFTPEAEGVLRKFYGPDRADDGFVFALFPENARKFL